MNSAEDLKLCQTMRRRLAGSLRLSCFLACLHVLCTTPAPAAAAESDKSVFIGGVGPHFCIEVSAPAVLLPLLQTGVIGLYQHANGIAGCSPGQRDAIWAAWGVGPSKTPDRPIRTVAEVGAMPASPNLGGYLAYFGGAYPAEVNMNAVTGSGDGTGRYVARSTDRRPGQSYLGTITPANLAEIRSAFQVARDHGAQSVALFITPNGGHEDLDDPFATSEFWRLARTAAQFGHGMALDVPPSYFVARGPQYQDFILQMLRWGAKQKLRTSLVISPFALKPDAAGHSNGCGFDPDFMANTRALVARIAAEHVFPTQWVVENYGLPGLNCGTGNDIELGDAPESLNSVALYLAHVVKNDKTN